MSIRHALLALLSGGPKYGLQLRQEFEAATGEVWPLNVGQVYTTLRRLERDGLVECDDAADDGPQKSFQITTRGERELQEWLRTPPDLSLPPRDELVIKVLVARRVAGVNVHEVIQTHRRYLVELMQQWTHMKEDEAEFDLNFALAVDAEIYRLDSVIRWLDAADGRVKRGEQKTYCRFRLPCRGCDAAWGYHDELPRASKGLQDVRGRSRRGPGPPLVDLSVDSGALVAVMGPSGSGKSTLLTIAGGLVHPTSGDVMIGGVSLSRISRSDQARMRRRSIGYVFQEFNLLTGLTALENVALPLELDGCTPARLATSVWSRSRNSGWPTARLTFRTTCRVVSVRGLLSPAPWSAIDNCCWRIEPSGALDSENGEAVMQLVLAACKRGVAAVVVTHDTQLASWADRVMFVRDGRVVDQTSKPSGPEDLLARAPNQ